LKFYFSAFDNVMYGLGKGKKHARRQIKQPRAARKGQKGIERGRRRKRERMAVWLNGSFWWAV
jgi:hypothetical protein